MSIASVFVSVEPLRRQKDTDCFVRVFCLVGVARLELAALRSRTVRATKLRYTPIKMCLFQSAVARLGARRAFPSGLAPSTTVSVICSYFEVYLIRFTQLFANQTALHPDKYVFCFNLLWRVWERVAHFRQVLRSQQQFR